MRESKLTNGMRPVSVARKPYAKPELHETSIADVVGSSPSALSTDSQHVVGNIIDNDSLS